MCFASLISRNNQENLLSYINVAAKEKLQNILKDRPQSIENPESISEQISKVHYSWLIKIIDGFLDEDKHLIISCLNLFQKNQLYDYYKLDPGQVILKKIAKEFLLLSIHKKLVEPSKEYLPIEMLPSNSLNPLLNLSKKEIVRLINFLGLFDLSSELKRIIKSDLLKRVQKNLDKQEQQFVKVQMKAKETIAFSGLNLDGWDGDKTKLKSLLQHRGMNRLAKSFFGCHQALFWHFLRRIDIGRASVLQKYHTDIKNSDALDVLKKQTLETLTFLKNREPI